MRTMKNPGSTSLKRADTMSLKKSLKGVYFILSVMIISLMHLPFAFAKTNFIHRVSLHPVFTASPANGIDPFTGKVTAASTTSIYDSLHLDSTGLDRNAFEYARKGWEKLVDQGLVQNRSILAIVDFSQPSNHKRLYVLDLENYKILFNTLVSHGRNSGREWASSFSNKVSSYKSSPGFYITGDTYTGDNGYSLRLTGVEKGINDNAFDRAIVMHGADYVNESFARARGYIGRSYGCPAVPRQVAKPIINTLKNGACLFVYAPLSQYSSRSSLLS